MVVKLRKWSPWPTMATRKFNVKIKRVKMEFGFDKDGFNEEEKAIMAIKMRWKGEPKFGLVPFHKNSKKRRKDISKEKIFKKDEEVCIEWDDEFENVCNFTIVSGANNNQKFGTWDISFSILSGEKMEQKAKMGMIGRVSLNIAEIASMMEPQVERKLTINLNFGGVAIEANLLVLLSFVEIRDSKDVGGIGQDSTQSTGDMREEEVKLENLVESREFTTIDTENAAESSSINMGPSTSSETQVEPIKKTGFFSWKRRRLSFIRPSLFKGEPSDKKTNNSNTDNTNHNRIDMDIQTSNCSTIDLVTSHSMQANEEGVWESKEFISRDGNTKLKTDVFFASFDQCSNKATGESACTTLAVVISHWLHLNRGSMPTRLEFDNLIVQGSYEWRKLCKDDAYTNDFPNKHFDLETALRADIKPISISHDDSFVGFFSPEKFEALKEAMSFDEIWNDINKMTGDYDQRVYIISWNDHFFVLKVEGSVYYIIDTLGERLYEGCNQAYILRFDHSTLMYGKTVQEEHDISEQRMNRDRDEESTICRGKECCKEYIKRFLAAIPLRELEAEEKNGTVSCYSLHSRLQIELNFSYLLSSSTSSPFSSSSNCSSSCSSSDESCI